MNHRSRRPYDRVDHAMIFLLEFAGGVNRFPWTCTIPDLVKAASLTEFALSGFVYQVMHSAVSFSFLTLIFIKRTH